MKYKFNVYIHFSYFTYIEIKLIMQNLDLNMVIFYYTDEI